MKPEAPSFSERLEFSRSFCSETSKLAGLAKGLKELIDSSSNPLERYYFKMLLESTFKSLMINFNILTLDPYSDIQIGRLIDDFEMKYGGRLKELGLDIDVRNEKKYRDELFPSIKLWNMVRNDFAAHRDMGLENDWIIDIDHISIFISSVCHIINTMTRTLSVPEMYPKATHSAEGIVKSAINLEEETYLDIKRCLKWIN